jgi:hypothetical protein
MSVVSDALGNSVEIFPWAAAESTNTPAARNYLGQKAAEGQRYAESIAPVSDTGSELSAPGAYRDSFNSTGGQGSEPEALITNNDPIWRFLEYGTIHNRPFRCLSNALIHISATYELN